VYGLAECSVGLALPPPGRGPVIDRIKRSEFVRTGRAVPAQLDELDALRFVACGQPLPGHEIRVVDAGGREVGERQEGRLEFKGPSATSGYLRNPEATRRLFKGDWLDSGDLAYIAGGDIYVTGRVKDVVIRAGRNIYPHELEQAIGDLPDIRKGCVAVFASPDPKSGTERLIIMAETREQDPEIRSRLRTAINGATLDLIGIAPDDIVLAPPHTVLKTSSGKIRRAASREAYEHGGRPLPLWREIGRVLAIGWLAQLRRVINLAADVGYAYYAWAIFGLLAPATWLITIVLPREERSWAVSRRAARAFLRLIGIRVFVQGLENLPVDGRCVAVANHASYADGIVLLAALARPFSFVAKRELQDRMISRVFLRHIGAQFVERFDPQRGVEDVHQVVRSVQAGRDPLFFPEGTFDRMPGLRSFRMGAFVVAAEAGLPVIPIALRGTRSILRAGHWLPRRGSISITIGSRISTQGSGWDAALALRDAARAEILRHCGEPDLLMTS
jgi:1-acyl-sn-glycerol-3-phosphate acyltransferase